VSVTSSSNRYWTFYRRTAYIVDPVTASSTVTVDRQPSAGSYMQVSVTDGTVGSGAVNITGTDADGSATEQLTFTKNGVQAGVVRFLTITEITTAGLNEPTIPTISVQAVSGDGGKNLIRYAVASDRPVAYMPVGKDSYPAYIQGSHEMDMGRVLVDYEEVWTPRVDDIAVDTQNSDEWVVVGVREVIIGFGIRPHHYEVRLKRFMT